MQTMNNQSTNIHRSCLKSQSDDHRVNEIHRSSTPYRVSFAHPNSSLVSTSDLGEKKRRSDVFMKKAKEFQLAEITSFKDHARDEKPTTTDE